MINANQISRNETALNGFTLIPAGLHGFAFVDPTGGDYTIIAGLASTPLKLLLPGESRTPFVLCWWAIYRLPRYLAGVLVAAKPGLLNSTPAMTHPEAAAQGVTGL